MKIQRVILEKNENVVIMYNVGNISPKEIDNHCKKLLKPLDSIFGKSKITLFPVRNGPEWDFTIVRKYTDK